MRRLSTVATQGRDTLSRTLIYSIGQTAVASTPPAIQPADMAKSGLFFFLLDMLQRFECFDDERGAKDWKKLFEFGGNTFCFYVCI